jgi:hypothetical protein
VIDGVPFSRADSTPKPRYSKGLADVAQLVEHFTRNEGVPGSSPGVGSPVQAEYVCRSRALWLRVGTPSDSK